MSYTQIYVHAVWATKDRKHLFNNTQKDSLCKHIREYAKMNNIHVLNVNGWQNHLHCLLSLNAGQNVITAINLMKGESSFWANRSKLFAEKFYWQNEYFAVSLGKSQLQIINDYIKNQEEHHKKNTFEEEYEEFMKYYKFDDDILL